jgi:hypothetical protein
VIVAAFALPLAWRIANRDMAFAPANVELITAGSLFLALVLGGRGATFAPLIIAVASDAVIGNSAVAIFTWSAWVVIGIAASRARGLVSGSTARGAIFGAATSTWFFLWTNFGVWLLSAGRFYSADLGGLVDSYVAGLPFYRNMLVCNIVLCPVAVATKQLFSAPVGDLRMPGGRGLALAGGLHSVTGADSSTFHIGRASAALKRT